jgi:antitoxin component YwqK of YwqJK toxin-antitoxin module
MAKEGTWKEYHENGQVSIQFDFVDGKEKEESLVHYYDNGQLMEEVTYLNGALVGIYQSFSKNGQISSEGKYYDRDGNVISEPIDGC